MADISREPMGLLLMANAGQQVNPQRLARFTIDRSGKLSDLMLSAGALPCRMLLTVDFLPEGNRSFHSLFQATANHETQPNSSG